MESNNSSSDKIIVDEYNNFAYNYVRNLNSLQQTLLNAYTDNQTLIRDVETVDNQTVITFFDIESELPVAMVVENESSIKFYGRKRKKESIKNKS